MLVQSQDVDRMISATPTRWRAFSPFGIVVKSGDLSTRHNRAEYIYNVYGSWQRKVRTF